VREPRTDDAAELRPGDAANETCVVGEALIVPRAG
jgi:hypothetical protein